MTLKPEDWEILQRFGGEPDSFGLGTVVVDTSEENLKAIFDAIRNAGPLVKNAARSEGDVSRGGPEVVRLNAALEWFGQNQGLSLEFDWSDADTDGLDWCVYRESGGINDREWTVVGSGPTPQAAILAAYKPFADRLPTEDGARERC